VERGATGVRFRQDLAPLLSALDEGGVFKKLWKSGLEEYAEVRGIEWKWQAADGAITKAPLGGPATGANPTDRGKRGTKRSMLAEAQGVPIEPFKQAISDCLALTSTKYKNELKSLLTLNFQIFKKAQIVTV
jgi:hypothetical protein